MPLSRKDYTLIAECLREHSRGMPPDRVASDGGNLVDVSEQDFLEDIVDTMAVRLLVDNPRFQRDRFIMAALGYVIK